ncbi:probable calcium-binding protein CML10 isoform X2 [Haliotis rubra]|uniref:probable calcium-binding protein CML10 isoform X2 n=1 Tax=Haliotis rubra TaxID=36100 RepID=UPI001EE6138D|nr:probable calcium-binding protein CML10 isoform X2 [Haliotis rubra]
MSPYEMLTLFLLGACIFVAGVVGHPARPPLLDLNKARHLFQLAEKNNGVTDGVLTKTEVVRIFTAFDGNGDGRVTETEFTGYWQKENLGDLQAAVYLFHRADTDNNGVLTVTPDLDRVFSYFDTDTNAKVTEAEFAVVWSSLTS